jgi:hypothetical protein
VFYTLRTHAVDCPRHSLDSGGAGAGGRPAAAPAVGVGARGAELLMPGMLGADAWDSGELLSP